MIMAIQSALRFSSNSRGPRPPWLLIYSKCVKGVAREIIFRGPGSPTSLCWWSSCSEVVRDEFESDNHDSQIRTCCTRVRRKPDTPEVPGRTSRAPHIGFWIGSSNSLTGAEACPAASCGIHRLLLTDAIAEWFDQRVPRVRLQRNA